MTNTLLVVVTALLTVTLTVLFRHIPKGEWITAVKWWLKLFWAFLLVMSPLSLVLVLIGALMRAPRPVELPPVVVCGIPMAFFFLSFVPFWLMDESETLWKRLRLSAWSTLMAFAVLLFSWWNPAARLWHPGFTVKMPLLGDLVGAIILTGGVVAYLIRHGWRELGR